MSEVAGADWGPWKQTITDAERRRAVLVLKTLASIIVGRGHPLYKSLSRADAAREDAQGALAVALLEAAIEVERLPALRRRQLISSYAGNMLIMDDAPRKHVRTKPKGAEAAA